MSDSAAKTTLLDRLIGLVGAWLLRVVGTTLRVKLDNEELLGALLDAGRTPMDVRPKMGETLARLVSIGRGPTDGSAPHETP